MMINWKWAFAAIATGVAAMPASAEPLALTDDNVCAWVLQQTTESELEAGIEVIASLEDFKDTKTEVSPLRVKQYRSPETGMAKSVACKLSSVQGLVEKGGVAAGELGIQRSCKAAHQRMLELEYQQLAPAQRKLSPADITLLDDETAWMGPQWLSPNPYPALSQDAQGKWQLQAKSLAVSNAWYIPLPASIKGVYYCTVVAPEYLRQVLSGAE